jgi:NAD(P) transhydrogenase subunit alpha
MGYEELAFILLLATWLGLEIIAKVPSTLHTPLMSGSNAISGITVIGALALVGQTESGSSLSTILASAGIGFAAVNVVGGYLVTDRMLRMFRSKDAKAPGETKRPEGGA